MEKFDDVSNKLSKKIIEINKLAQDHHENMWPHTDPRPHVIVLAGVFSQTAAHVCLHRVNHRIHVGVFKEVACAFYFLMGDGDAFLLMQFVDQRHSISRRRYAIGQTIDHEAGCRAGR